MLFYCRAVAEWCDLFQCNTVLTTWCPWATHNDESGRIWKKGYKIKYRTYRTNTRENRPVLSYLMQQGRLRWPSELHFIVFFAQEHFRFWHLVLHMHLTNPHALPKYNIKYKTFLLNKHNGRCVSTCRHSCLDSTTFSSAYFVMAEQSLPRHMTIKTRHWWEYFILFLG